MIKIDDWIIQKGEKSQGEIAIIGGGRSMPATVICGVEEGPTILITAGIHNAEYVGIQAAMELAQEFQPEDLSGNVIFVPLVNVSGFENRTMSTVYEDGKNLNRVFPGKADGTQAERIACTIVQKLFSLADYYIDLHSGDGFEQLHPHVYYVGVVDEKTADASLHMARHISSRFIVRSKCADGGAYNYASSMGIPSILIERGGQSAWSWEEVEQDKRDVEHLILHLQGKRCRGLKHTRQMILENVVYECAPYTGCWYPMKKPGEYFFKGEELGELRDYYGNKLYTSIAMEDGVILYQTISLSIIEEGPMISYASLTRQLV